MYCKTFKKRMCDRSNLKQTLKNIYRFPGWYQASFSMCASSLISHLLTVATETVLEPILYQIQKQVRAPGRSVTCSLPARPLSAGNPPSCPDLESWTWCWACSAWLCQLWKHEDRHVMKEHNMIILQYLNWFRFSI